MQNDKENFKKNFSNSLIKFSIHSIKLAEKINKNDTLRPIANQLINSSTSVGANVVEVKSSSSKRDYIRFFEFALKFANETKYWLILIKEVFPKLKKETNYLSQEMEEISNIIGASVLTLKRKK